VLAVVVNGERVSAENDVFAFLPIDDEVPNRRSPCVGPKNVRVQALEAGALEPVPSGWRVTRLLSWDALRLPR
jgi:hypothetical protein